MNNTFRILAFCLSFLLLAGLAPNAFAQDATTEVVTGTNLASGIVPESITEGSQIAIYKTLRLSAAQSQAVPFRVCFTTSLSSLNLNINDGINVISLTNGCHDSSIPSSNRNGPQYRVFSVSDDTDEPDEVVTLTFTDDPDNARPAGVAAINLTTTVVIRDDDATVVSLTRQRGSPNTIREGGSMANFTVALSRMLIAGEIIDVPLPISGTGITPADWSLGKNADPVLNTGVTLVNTTTAIPVVRFSGAGAQMALLTLSAAIDNVAESGGSETLTLELGPNDTSNSGFDLASRDTNVGGGAERHGTNNALTFTINDTDDEPPMPAEQRLKTITEPCSITKTQLDDMAPTATDNHPEAVTVTNNIGKFPITSDTTITWTYTDASNNKATQMQDVVIDLNVLIPDAPTLSDLTVQCPIATLNPPTARNCSGETLMGTANVTPPIMASTTITWTYTDGGNMTTQTQEVVIDDTMDPVPSPDNELLPLSADCSLAIGDINIPTATDNCDSGTIMATANVTPPITASTTIMWTYTDAVGNTATQTQEVTIADKMPPMPNPSNDLSEITQECSLGENELRTPAATDNCTGSVTVTNDVATFPITESRMITWTYTDGANNTATQTQRVTIADTMDPVPMATDLPTLEDCSQITSLTAPTATDNCDGTIMASTTVTPPITTNMTITWTYRDDAGNTATQTQEVIIGDTEAPMPETSNLPTLTGECPVTTIANLTVPTATDNCDAGTITATTDVAIFPITSTTTITWTYRDAADNTATQTQEVICPLSAAEDTEEAIIFPNPSEHYLEVRSPVGGMFKILSLSGKLILEGTTNTRTDITSLRSGLYLVQLPDGRLLKFLRE